MMVGAALDRSEPSPRSTSNGIHTKSEDNNLQGNGLATGPGASQVPNRRESQNSSLSISRTLSLEMREHTWPLSHELSFLSKEHHQSLGFFHRILFIGKPHHV